MDAVLGWLGYGLCHQLPERSFFGGGMQVPVCARDTGIYAGFAIGLLVLALTYRSRRPSELPPWRVMALLGLFILTMAVDGVTSYAGWRTTTNDLRLITGLLTGYALVAMTVPLLNSQVWSRYDSDRLLGERGPLLTFLVSIPLAFVAIRYAGPLLGSVYPILVAVSIVVTFGCVNLIIVCLVPWFERRANTLSDLTGAIVVAMLLTAVELGLASALRLWLERLAGLAS